MKTLDPKIIPILEEKYGKYWWPVKYPEEVFHDPFKNLIITILSQNTSEINCVRAYEGLTSKFEVKPEILAKADENEIKEAIRRGGLYNVKAKRIKEVSKAVLEKMHGTLEYVLTLPKEEAKKKLMELPGIGDKTADVLLSSRHGYREVFVIDTHINRIAKRLGLVERNAKYSEVQDAIKRFMPKNERVGGLFWATSQIHVQSAKSKMQRMPPHKNL